MYSKLAHGSIFFSYSSLINSHYETHRDSFLSHAVSVPLSDWLVYVYMRRHSDMAVSFIIMIHLLLLIVMANVCKVFFVLTRSFSSSFLFFSFWNKILKGTYKGRNNCFPVRFALQVWFMCRPTSQLILCYWTCSATASQRSEREILKDSVTSMWDSVLKLPTVLIVSGSRFELFETTTSLK